MAKTKEPWAKRDGWEDPTPDDPEVEKPEVVQQPTPGVRLTIEEKVERLAAFVELLREGPLNATHAALQLGLGDRDGQRYIRLLVKWKLVRQVLHEGEVAYQATTIGKQPATTLRVIGQRATDRLTEASSMPVPTDAERARAVTRARELELELPEPEGE